MDEASVDWDEAYSDPRVVELTPTEIQFLVRVCRKHRSSIPIYLQSSTPELELIEGILKKIA